MPTLDSVITARSPVVYFDDFSTAPTDVGSLGSTWACNFAFGKPNVVPSEAGGSSKSAQNTAGGFLEQTGGFSPGNYTEIAFFTALQYQGVTGSGTNTVLFSTGHVGTGNPQASCWITDDGAGNTALVGYPGFTSGATNGLNVSYPFVVGTNYDILVVFGAAALTFYVNGAQIGTVVTTRPIDPQLWVIGSGFGTGGSVNGYYQRTAVFANHGIVQADATALHNAWLGADSVTVLSPNGGETFGTAQAIAVSVRVGGTVTNADLYWTTNAGTTKTLIASNVAASGGICSANWTPIHTAGTYQIYAQKAGDATVNALSAADFTIAPSTVTVNNPACSKIASRTSGITWTAFGLDTVDVKLSTDGGATYPTTLATGVAANLGRVKFWVESSYISSNCKIQVTSAGPNSSTSIFSIVAPSNAALQPTLTLGAGSASFTPPSGSGATPSCNWDVIPGEGFAATRQFGVGALCALTDPISGTGAGDSMPGIECVVMRANGGPWVYIPQPSLNSSSVRSVQWTPGAHMYGNPAFATIRATQEFCATLNPSGLAANTQITLQSYVIPYSGIPTALPDVIVVANPTEHDYYVDSVNGTSGGTGAVNSPIDTIAHAVTAAFTNSQLEGLHIKCQSGSYTPDSNSGTTGYIVTVQPITIEPAPGVTFGQAKMIGVTGTTTYWQASGLHIKDMVVDWSDNTTTAMITGGVPGGASYWLDGCEVFGAGPGDGTTTPLGAACPSGFAASYVTECYVHDIGGGAGHNNFYCEPNVLRNTFDWHCGGKQGGEAGLSLNFSVKDLLQLDDEHSDIYGLSGNCGGQVIIGTFSENSARAVVPLQVFTTIRQALINCDFSAYPGNQNDSSIGGQDDLYAYLRFSNDSPDYCDHDGPNVNMQMHANIFDGGVINADPSSRPGHGPYPYTEATWTYNDTGIGNQLAGVDTNVTSGGVLTFNADRTPAAGNNNFNSGIPIWPYDALNNLRGLHTPGHWTAKGPYAAAAEYVNPAGGGGGSGMIGDIEGVGSSGMIGVGGVSF